MEDVLDAPVKQECPKAFYSFLLNRKHARSHSTWTLPPPSPWWEGPSNTKHNTVDQPCKCFDWKTITDWQIELPNCSGVCSGNVWMNMILDWIDGLIIGWFWIQQCTLCQTCMKTIIISRKAYNEYIFSVSIYGVFQSPKVMYFLKLLINNILQLPIVSWPTHVNQADTLILVAQPQDPLHQPHQRGHSHNTFNAP